MHSQEEKANFLTHAAGLLLAVGGLLFLYKSSIDNPDMWRRISFIIYGFSIVFLFASSTFYHASTNYRTKRILQIVDHIAIYLLIAGTYTPFLLGPLRGNWGWTLLVIIWTMAIGGSLFKFWFTGQYNRISTSVYLGMGWMAIVAVKPMIDYVPIASLFWLIGGGLCYTIGVYFYNKTSWRYHHAVWHLFVLAGSACHFVSISKYL